MKSQLYVLHQLVEITQLTNYTRKKTAPSTSNSVSQKSHIFNLILREIVLQVYVYKVVQFHYVADIARLGFAVLS